MKYKKGDKVKIREDLALGTRVGALYVADDMLPYRGELTTIRGVHSDFYDLDIDNGKCGWTDEMLEPVETKEQEFRVGDKVRVIKKPWEDGPWHRFSIGDMCTVASVGDEYIGVVGDDDGTQQSLCPVQIEKVEEDKSEEREHSREKMLHHLGLRFESAFGYPVHPSCRLAIDGSGPYRHTFSIVKPKKKGGGFMTQLSKLAKKLLDADTKALVKAGILDSELDVTEEGEAFVLAFVIEKNKVELAKEARKLLQEQKKEGSEE